MNERRKQRIEHYYQNKIPNYELLIDNVWDPHNVAAVTRTADGLGIATINLYYTYNDFPNLTRSGKKTSSSANKWVHYHRVDDLGVFVEDKHQQGFQIIGATASQEVPALHRFDYPEKGIIVMGSESKGMSEELAKVCDKWVTIPMVGMVESYNISVAAALMLYELYRQKGQHLTQREPSPPRD